MMENSMVNYFKNTSFQGIYTLDLVTSFEALTMADASTLILSMLLHRQ